MSCPQESFTQRYLHFHEFKNKMNNVYYLVLALNMTSELKKLRSDV